MPRIEHIIIGLIVVWALLAFVRHANRTEEDKAKPSWAVRAINAAGGNVEATRLLPATGELVGRGTVAAAGKAGDVGKAKVDDFKAKVAEFKGKHTEAREARGERVAELGDKARAAAAKRGLAVVEAVERRWTDRKPDRPRLFSWGRRGDAEDTAPGGEPVAGPAGAGARLPDPADVDAWRDELRARREAAGKDRPQDPAAGTDTTTQEDRVTATDERKLTDDPHPGRTVITTPTDAMRPDGPPPIPMPIDWRAVAGRVAEFNPESDADLINFMSMEIAGMCGYSDAYEQLFETCTKSLGLDPRSVAGLGEFGERVVELTREMALAHKRFVVIYAEVMRMVADGTVMPHNGRFFSGDVAV